MQIIIFKKYFIPKLNKERFHLKGHSSQESLVLANFLQTEAKLSRIKKYKKWAFDPEQNSASGDEVCLEKENEYIYIYDLLLGKDYDIGPYYRLNEHDFVELLNQWEKALLEKPDEIIICKQNKKLEVKPVWNE